MIQKLLLTITLTLFWFICSAEVPGEGDLEHRVNIYHNKGKVLESVAIYKVHKYKLVYEKDGNLHDLLKSDVIVIDYGDTVIYFDESGIPVKESRKNWKEMDEYNYLDRKPGGIDYYRTIIKLMPVNIYKQYVLVGVEMPVSISSRPNRHHSFLIEGGVIFPRGDFQSGFVLRSELMFYFDRLKQGERLSRNTYWSPQVFYKYTSEEERETNNIGMHFKVGLQEVYSNNFVIDMYAGIGFRAELHSYYPDIEREEMNPTSTRVSGTFGFRFGYAL